MNASNLALDHLERVTSLDPLYKPARFFLAYVTLLTGRVEEAAQLFSEMTDPINKDAELILQTVKEKWPQTGIRAGFLLKLIEPLRRSLLPWVQFQSEITTHLIGSTLYRYAQRWNEFDQTLQAWKQSTPKWKPFHYAALEFSVAMFPEQWGIREYVKIVAGLAQGDVSPENARATLDFALSESALDRFDMELERLEFDLLLLSTRELARRIDESADTRLDEEIRERKSRPIFDLRDTGPGVLLTPGLNKLEELWKSGDWEACTKQLKELRAWTRPPSDSEAGSMLLRALNLPKSSAWLIRFFLPAFTLLDQWRSTFRHAFFLEAEFYAAVANYRLFNRSGMTQAMKAARALYERFLVGPAPDDMNKEHYRDLQVLVRCLEADAAARLMIDKTPDPGHDSFEAERRLRELEKNLTKDLLRITNTPTRKSDLRSAAFNTLGLLERRKERGTIETALRYFFKALETKPTPDTCFYIAEILIERNRTAEASRYLKNALRLCPEHAGALALPAKTAHPDQPGSTEISPSVP